MRVVLVVAALAGCSAETTGTPASHDAPKPGGDGNITTMRHRRYAGQIASLGPVPFGGMGYCDYQVTLQNVKVDLVLLEKFEMSRLVLTDTRIEETLNMCPYTPSPPNDQVFEHTGGAVIVDGMGRVAPSITGASGNSPATNLAITVSDIHGEAPIVEATWHRTDQPAPLDWTVMTSSPIALSPQTCVAGMAYCVGRELEGQIYVCNSDSVTLTEDKHCDAGCASASSCR